MGQKMKIAGWVAIGALAGSLTTVSLQTVARNTMTPLPLEELQQLSTVFGLIKSEYVEPVDEKKLIAGDTLFLGSVGRTDLPGGDPDAIAKSVRGKLYTLPEDTVVIAGHGGPTTIGREKQSNMFVRP
jgi:hypothetical protein